jgi:hypothetical protein
MSLLDDSNFTGKGNAHAYWYNTGKHFGFPDCCIKAFIEDNLPETNSSVFSGTGYRPCENCSKIEPDELIVSINKRRSHPYPFPDSRNFVRDFREDLYSL